MTQLTQPDERSQITRQLGKLPNPWKAGLILALLDALTFVCFWVFGGITRAVIVTVLLVLIEVGVALFTRMRHRQRNPESAPTELVSLKEEFDPTVEDTTPEPTPLPELPPPSLRRQLARFGGLGILLVMVLVSWATATIWIIPSIVTFVAIILGAGWLLMFKRRKEIDWPVPVGTKVLFPVSPAAQWKIHQRIVITRDPINLLPKRPVTVIALIVGLAVVATSVPVTLWFYPGYTLVALSVIGVVLAVFAFDAAYFCLWDSRYNYAILDPEGLKIYRSWIRKKKKNYPRGAWLSANMEMTNLVARARGRDVADISVLIADEEDAHLFGIAFASEILDIIQDLIHRESQLAEDDATIQRAQLEKLAGLEEVMQDVLEAVSTNTALMAFLSLDDPGILGKARAHFTDRQLELMGFAPPEELPDEPPTQELPATNGELERTARIYPLHRDGSDDPTQP